MVKAVSIDATWLHHRETFLHRPASTASSLADPHAEMDYPGEGWPDAALLLEYLSADAETLESISTACIEAKASGTRPGALVHLDLHVDAMLLHAFDSTLGSLLLLHPLQFSDFASDAIEAWVCSEGWLCRHTDRLVVSVGPLNLPADIPELHAITAASGWVELAGRVAAVALPTQYVASTEWRCPMHCSEHVSYDVFGFRPCAREASRCPVCNLVFTEVSVLDFVIINHCINTILFCSTGVVMLHKYYGVGCDAWPQSINTRRVSWPYITTNAGPYELRCARCTNTATGHGSSGQPLLEPNSHRVAAR